jgi:hypothetical protein
MLSAALGLALLAPASGEVVETRCLDTWVDKNHPDANYGHDFALAVGPGAGTLVRFPVVDLALPPRSRIVDARLEFKLMDKTGASNVTVAEMTQDWGEGGGLGRDDAPGKPAPKGWATWKASLRGSTGWSIAIDSPRPSINGVQAKVEGDKLVVSGLGAMVKAWQEDPSRNHGLLLTSPENAVFGSSESPNRPRLVITTEAEPGDKPDLALAAVLPTEKGWNVTVANLGTAPSAMAKLEWTGAESGSLDVTSLEPGQRTALPVPGKGPVSIRIAAREDGDFSNNFQTVSSDDRVAKLGDSLTEMVAWQKVAHEMNAWCLPRSRSFGFQDGSSVRVRVEPGTPGLPETTERTRTLLSTVIGLNPALTNPSVLRRGLGWSTDTRDDTFWINGLPLPPEDVTVANAYPLPDPRLLGSADLYLLANPGPTLPPGPPALLLRVKDAAGDAVAEPQLKVIGSDGKELGTVMGNANGSVGLQGGKGLLPDPAHPWLEYRLTKGGETASVWVSMWDMWREVTRTGKGVATIELRLPLPASPIDRSSDLAYKRIVGDEAKRKPGVLDAVVDNDDESSLSLDSDAGQGWVEIDLSRDQPIAEVQLVFRGAVPDNWKISTSETGADDQVVWVKEEFGVAQAAKWGTKTGNLTTVKVRARVRRARSVRFSLSLHQRADLVGVKVYGVGGS